MATKQQAGAEQSLVCGRESCGRALFGRVNFCPFCGATVSQGSSPTVSQLRPTASPKVSSPAAPQPAARPPATEQVEKRTDAVQSDPTKALDKGERRALVASEPVEPEMQAEVIADSPKKKKRWGRWFLGVLFAFVAWQLLVPAGADPCATTLAAAEEAVQRGQTDAVKTHAVEAIAACRGEQQTKARALFSEVEKKIATDQSCRILLQEYKTLLGQGRLQQAIALASPKLRDCDSSGAQAREREIQEIRQLISAKQEAVRMRLEAGDYSGARTVVDELRGIDRENSSLPSLSAAIERAEKEARVRQEAESAASASPQPPPVPAATVPQPVPSNSGQEMAIAMLREGEAALAQKRYAEARALAASILRAMPSSLQARDLMNRANEAETRALREETILK